MVAVTLFVLSMSTVLFFFGENADGSEKDLKTNLMEGSSMTESIDIKSPQESEQKYRKVVNNIEDPVFVLNLDGTLKFASWDVENTLEYKPEELDHQIFFLMIHPEDLSTFLGAFGKVIQNKKPVSMVGPYRLRDKKGEYHLHMGSMQPIMSHGEVEEVAVSSKDISKKVQNEHKVQKEQKKSTAPTSKKIMNQKESDHGRFLADMNGQSVAGGDHDGF